MECVANHWIFLNLFGLLLRGALLPFLAFGAELAELNEDYGASAGILPMQVLCRG